MPQQQEEEEDDIRSCSSSTTYYSPDVEREKRRPCGFSRDGH